MIRKLLAAAVTGLSLAAVGVSTNCRLLAQVDDKYLVEAGPDGCGVATGTLVCAPGTADCNGDPCDGCETRTDSDPENCGRCGRACDTPACAAGRCDPVRLGVAGAWVYNMVVADGAVYWVHDFWTPAGVLCDDHGASVRAVSGAGGKVSDLAPSGGTPTGIGVAGGFVYWASSAEGTIARVPADGGTKEYVIPPSDPLPQVDGLVLDGVDGGDGGSLYFTRTFATPVGVIGRVATSGGPVTVVSAGWQGLVSLAADDTQLYWPVSAGAAFMEQGLWRMPKAGGDAGRLLSSSVAGYIAVDDTYVYWTDAVDGKVWKVLKEGVPNAGFVAQGQPGANFVLVDRSAVYFTANDGVKRVDKDAGAGASVQTLALFDGDAGPDACAPSFAPALAIDDADQGHVYFTFAGVLYRIPK